MTQSVLVSGTASRHLSLMAVHFPRRNCIIGGMSVGVAVVRATLKSSLLIMSQYAIEQGREVFGVPRSIRHGRSKGHHFLIKQGAKLAESVWGIIEKLVTLVGAVMHEQSCKDVAKIDHAFDNDHKRLLKAMAYDPVSVDQLIA